MKIKIALLLLAVTLLLGFVAGCAKQGTKTSIPSTPSEETGESPTEAPTNEIPVGETKEFNITARQWSFEPSTIRVKKGDKVILHITSVDVAHGFALPAFGIDEYLEPGKTVRVEFIADKTGTFSFACSVYCGAGHSSMTGQLIVEG